MPSTITLNVTKGNSGKTQPFTIQTENSSFINSIITVQENNTITATDMNKLQSVAKRAGDAGVLEFADLNAQEKLNLASVNNYNNMYEITLSSDGKYFQVKVKDSWKDPTLSDIKADFGVKSGVFVGKGEIPHGNENLINSRIRTSNVYSGNNLDYDAVKLQANDVINIPVNEITSLDGPRGFWGRLLKP